MVLLEDLIRGLPPVTRIVIGASTVIALLCTLDMISPLSLYLNWDLIYNQRQWWRLISCFFFLGELNLQFCWNIFIYIQYCSSLEEVSFRGKTPDFVWMLVSAGSLLLFFSYTFKLSSIFLSSSLMDVMTYVWSKKNPAALVQVFFITLSAAYLPFVLTALSFLMGGSVVDHIIGIFVGHIYYFFTEIYPLMPTSGGIRIFKTPKLLKIALGYQD